MQARRDVRRQIGRLDDVAAREDGRALDRVLELAHVAGPRVAKQTLDRLGRQAQLAAELAAGAREKVLGQRRNVFAAVAKWRQEHLDDVQAIEEIFAKGPLGE